MGLFDKARSKDTAMRAPEALQAAAKADPEGAAASGLEVPEVAVEPAPVAKAEVPAATPPKGAGKPRRVAKDTDESYAARVREWEKANNVVTTEGEEAQAEEKAEPGTVSKLTGKPIAELAKGVDAATKPAAFGPPPDPAMPLTVSVSVTGDVGTVRDLIRRLGGAL